MNRSGAVQRGVRATPNVGVHRARARCFVTAVALATLLPLHAWADDAIDPTLIPDGTYPAHVDRVINAQRIAVTMQGTLKVFLSAGRPSINFVAQVKPNDDVDVTLSDGKVVGVNRK